MVGVNAVSVRFMFDLVVSASGEERADRPTVQQRQREAAEDPSAHGQNISGSFCDPTDEHRDCIGSPRSDTISCPCVQARRNREIAILQRKIDEVPSRAELTQYQKRFIELYSQGGFHVGVLSV